MISPFSGGLDLFSLNINENSVSLLNQASRSLSWKSKLHRNSWIKLDIITALTLNDVKPVGWKSNGLGKKFLPYKFSVIYYKIFRKLKKFHFDGKYAEMQRHEKNVTFSFKNIRKTWKYFYGAEKFLTKLHHYCGSEVLLEILN